MEEAEHLIYSVKSAINKLKEGVYDLQDYAEDKRYLEILKIKKRIKGIASGLIRDFQ